MANKPKLLDRWGNPVRRVSLKAEVSAPTIGGVRSPISGYPADGLNPLRLASILRQADAGDPVRYLELAEIIEERDPHYLGVLGTRKRSVSQIEITVEAGGEDKHDLEMADMLREWLKRDELSDELFDILDSIGKGYSFTEIIWDTSEGQWYPARLEWRDPRWFRFQRHDLATPMMLDEHGQETELPAFKFIYARMRAKSGIALRSGLARVAAWGWMFKAYTQRDWAIFTQTYGQPLRVGKYGAGASAEDRATLFRAVSNIAGDCAAIIPESMIIDFVESKNVGSTTDHYESRSDWLDKQISKAVLGQTATTDAVTGGLGSGKEHREVQQDIEAADCKALQSILNRDLARPYVQLEYGPQKRYPRFVIKRVEPEDLKAFSDAVGPMIDRGLRVGTAEVLGKFGLKDPGQADEILMPSTKSAANMTKPPIEGDENPPERGVKHPLKGRVDKNGMVARQAEENAPEGDPAPLSHLVDRLAADAAPGMADILEQVEVMMDAASSFQELREMLLTGLPDIDTATLTDVVAQALTAAHLGGRVALKEEAGG